MNLKFMWLVYILDKVLRSRFGWLYGRNKVPAPRLTDTGKVAGTQTSCDCERNQRNEDLEMQKFGNKTSVNVIKICKDMDKDNENPIVSTSTFSPQDSEGLNDMFGNDSKEIFSTPSNKLSGENEDDHAEEGIFGTAVQDFKFGSSAKQIDQRKIKSPGVSFNYAKRTLKFKQRSPGSICSKALTVSGVPGYMQATRSSSAKKPRFKPCLPITAESEEKEAVKDERCSWLQSGDEEIINSPAFHQMSNIKREFDNFDKMSSFKMVKKDPAFQIKKLTKQKLLRDRSFIEASFFDNKENVNYVNSKRRERDTGSRTILS